MNERNKSPISARIVKLGGAVALGAVLIWSPAVSTFADDAAPAAAAAAPAAGAAAAPATAAPAPKPTDVVAKVGDESITEADLGYAAEDTRGNADEAAEWVREHGFKSLIVVTARYHMPRALQEFSFVMPDVTLIAYPVDNGSVAVTTWWRHRGSALLLQQEYMKYLASLAAHSISHLV